MDDKIELENKTENYINSKSNPSCYSEFIENLYQLYQVASEQSVQDKIKARIKTTLSDWQDHVIYLTDYVEYLAYTGRPQTKWLEENQLFPPFNHEKLARLLKTREDYKIILQSIFQSSIELRAIDELHQRVSFTKPYSFLMDNAPVTVWIATGELKKEGKLSEPQLKEANSLQNALDDSCSFPLLRVLANLGGKKAFFDTMVHQTDQSLAELDQAVIKFAIKADAVLFDRAYFEFVNPLYYHQPSQEFLLSLLGLFMLLPKPSAGVYESHLRQLYFWRGMETKIGDWLCIYDDLINDLLISRAQSLQTLAEVETFKTLLLQLKSEGNFSDHRLEQQILHAICLEDVERIQKLKAFKPKMLMKFSTPEQVQKFVDQLLILKEHGRLADDQLDTQLLIQILTEGAEQAAKTKGESDYFDDDLNDDVSIPVSLPARLFLEYLGYVYSKYSKITFSEAEKKHLKALEHKILIEQVKDAFDFNPAHLDQDAITLKLFYYFCENHGIAASDLLKQATAKLTIVEYQELVKKLFKYAAHHSSGGLVQLLFVLLEIAKSKANSPEDRIYLIKFLKTLNEQFRFSSPDKQLEFIHFTKKISFNNSNSKVITDFVKELRYKLICRQISSSALSTGDVKQRANDTEAHAKKAAKKLLKALPVICGVFTGFEAAHDVGKAIKSTRKALHVASFLTMIPPINSGYKEFKKKLREFIDGDLPSSKQQIKMFARLFSGQEGEDQLNHFIEYLVHYYEEPLSRCHSDMGNVLASAVLDSISYAVVSLVVENIDMNIDNLIAEVLKWLAIENIGTQEVIILNDNEEKIKAFEIFRHSGFKCWDEKRNEVFFDLKESDEIISKTNGKRFGYRRANEQMVKCLQTELQRYKSHDYLPDNVFYESTLRRYQNASLQVIPMKNCRCYGNRLQKVENQLEKIEHQVPVKENQDEKIQKLQEAAKLKDEEIIKLKNTVGKLEMNIGKLNKTVEKLNTTIEDMKVEIAHLKIYDAGNLASFVPPQQQNRAAYTSVFSPAVPQNTENQLEQTQKWQYFTHSPNQ